MLTFSLFVSQLLNFVQRGRSFPLLHEFPRPEPLSFAKIAGLIVFPTHSRPMDSKPGREVQMTPSRFVTRRPNKLPTGKAIVASKEESVGRFAFYELWNL